MNIPLNEVPFSNSIEAIILYLTVGLVLVAPNYYCYKQFSVLPNCGTKLLFLLRKPFLFCLLISFSFYVVAFFVMNYKHSILDGWFIFSNDILSWAIQIGLVSIGSAILLTILSSIFAIVISVLNNHNTNDISDPKISIEAIKTQPITSRSLPRLLISLSSVIGVIVIIIILFGAISVSCNNTNQKIISIDNEDYTVVFSNSDSYCIKRCEVCPSEQQGKALVIYLNEYQWISKNNTNVEVACDIRSIELVQAADKQ